MSATREGSKLESDLLHFHGGDQIYHHPMFKWFQYSAGVRFLAREAGAYWLIEEIAGIIGMSRRVRDEEFQVWTLSVADAGRAVISMDDGNGRIVYEKIIPWTDFPLKEIKFYYENYLLCLPAER